MMTPRFGNWYTGFVLKVSLLLFAASAATLFLTTPATFDPNLANGELLRTSFIWLTGIGGLLFGALTLVAAASTPTNSVLGR